MKLFFKYLFGYFYVWLYLNCGRECVVFIMSMDDCKLLDCVRCWWGNDMFFVIMFKVLVFLFIFFKMFVIFSFVFKLFGILFVIVFLLVLFLEV